MSGNDNSENKEVELSSKSLKDLFGLSLKIPDYQRIYCWEEKNVIRLLDDIKEYASKKEYHMGSVILHKNSKGYNIVDGQQRLVTLALLIHRLETSYLVETDYTINNNSLLNQKFESREAIEYIGYNKSVIENYVSNGSNKTFFNAELVSEIKENLTFSVLELNSDNLDLAYTFFSSENSKGKALSDYDLLKSHHLRFVHIPEQAQHLAERWDNIVIDSNNDDTTAKLARTFDIYLFRLRKWMKKHTLNLNEDKKIKNEFQAALVIPDIPPFGEQFYYYESIQGGTHFFAYAEHFIQRYLEFEKNEVLICLKNILNGEKHWWYRDVIEAFLFGYFLKFGSLYIADACVLITRLISQHRYDKGRANFQSILNYAGDTEIIMMIDQATSPTFFLAEMQAKVNNLPNQGNLTGTRARFKNKVGRVNWSIKKDCVLEVGE